MNHCAVAFYSFFFHSSYSSTHQIKSMEKKLDQTPCFNSRHTQSVKVNKALSCTCHSIIMTHSIMMFVFVLTEWIMSSRWSDSVQSCLVKHTKVIKLPPRFFFLQTTLLLVELDDFGRGRATKTKDSAIVSPIPIVQWMPITCLAANVCISSSSKRISCQ